MSSFKMQAVLCCALLLSACGGGSDAPPPAPPPPPPAPVTYTVGGTLSGLASGASVVLQNNGGASLTVSANGPFTFATPVNSGGAYAVTVLTQPATPPQSCTVAGGSGTAAANVTTVAVTCANTDTAAPTIVSATPLPTAVGAPVQGPVITVTFSEAMNPATVSTASLSLTGPAGPVAGTVTLAAGNTRAEFTPAARLAFDAEYTASVTTAVRDISGNALATGATWQFNSGKAMAVGAAFNCVRRPDGRVQCWGDNTWGQLGYDDTQDRGNGVGPSTGTLAAVNLGTGRTAVAIAAADYNACAILDDGNLKCWGRNDTGAAGQGAITGASINIGDQPGEMAALQPINFGAGRRVLEVSIGQGFACARLDNATIKCWGANGSAQLGRGSSQPLGIAPGDIAAAAPVALGTGLTPVQISLGHYHSCALLVNGAGERLAKCWGDNNWGQVGKGNTDATGNDPAELGDGLPAVNFGAGRSPRFLMATGGHTCAQLDDLSTKCWGLNTWGQVGLNAGNGTLLTADVNVRRTCVPHALACIGDEPGEMGDALPAAIPAGQTARLSVGYRHGCVLNPAGAVVCWGSNEQAQMGIGTGGTVSTSASIVGDEPGEMAALTATSLPAPRTFEELSAGGFQTCVVSTTLQISCWGDNAQGQLGRNDLLTPIGDSLAEMGNALVDVSLGT